MFLLLLAACSKPIPSALSKPDPNDHQQLMDFFAKAHETSMDRDPIWRTYLGIGDEHNEWTLHTEERAEETLRLVHAQETVLQAIVDRDELVLDDALSYDLFMRQVQSERDWHTWRHHGYPVNQMHGGHTRLPNFMLSIQPLEDEADIHDWIARLDGIEEVVELLVQDMNKGQELGVIPPSFVFPKTIEDCENLLAGAPFEEDAEPGPWLAGYDKRTADIELEASERSNYRNRVIDILLDEVGPSYEAIIAELKEQQAEATDDDGAWKLPDGDEYYRWRLQQSTTKDDADPEAIHQLGLDQVKRIHGEMDLIRKKVGFEGTLAEFFVHMRTSDEFVLPDTDEGREEYLTRARAAVDKITERLPELFITSSVAPLEVRRVEEWREKSAGKAFYMRGTPDGSRPGIFYANLSDMSQVPTYQLEALVFHEGLPGHHMQLSIAQELEGLPDFRKHGHFTAWSEGWGLYSERLPSEIGLYEDPYSDFGRLAMELWRAGRLVVDTGIHHKRWTRQEAIDWLVTNTPNSESDATKSVERYIVTPGQATAYMVGMLEILRMREEAKEALGDEFDLPAFHDVILQGGPMPMSALDARVKQWVADTQHFSKL